MPYEYKGYLTTKQEQELYLTHGEITSLPFGTPRTGEAFFSIVAISKVGVTDEPVLNPGLMVILDLQFIADEHYGPFPLCKQRASADAYPQWSDRTITYLPNTTLNQTVLTSYRLFWRAGKVPPASV